MKNTKLGLCLFLLVSISIPFSKEAGAGDCHILVGGVVWTGPGSTPPCEGCMYLCPTFFAQLVQFPIVGNCEADWAIWPVNCTGCQAFQAAGGNCGWNMQNPCPPAVFNVVQWAVGGAACNLPTEIAQE